MIDTHCHLIPAVDDGPKTDAEAIELARALIAAGVHTVLCTPHYSRRYPTDHSMALDRAEALAASLAGAGVALDLMLGAEVSSAAAVEAPAEELRLRHVGRHYLLVELEADTPAGIVDVVLDRLTGMGLMPVFAHPERCRAIREQPRILDHVRAAGAPVQIVARSLMGRSGRSTAAAAWGMLDAGRVDLLASDAHAARQAGESLAKVLARVARRFGESALTELVEENPALMLALEAPR